MNFVNRTGMRYGMLTVSSRNLGKKTTKVYWNCVCDCGKSSIVQTTKLTSGRTKSCGCLRRKSNMIDLTGRSFSKLVVVSFHSKTENGRVRWNCICNCGNTTIVRAHNLASGEVKSCGCLSKMAHNVKHGLTNHRLFNIFDNMKARCYRKTCSSYKSYGARGISIHKEWLSDFLNFYNWAYQHGYKDDLSIERVDVNGNYEPSNCCWIPMSEQWKNKRNILGQEVADLIRIKIKQGVTIPDLAKFYNVHKDTIRNIKTGRSYFDIKMD